MIMSPYLLSARPKQFRFQRMWNTHTDFKKVVKNSWEQECQGTGLSALPIIKLKRLKKVLKYWNWTTFGNIFEKLNIFIDKIIILE